MSEDVMELVELAAVARGLKGRALERLEVRGHYVYSAYDGVERTRYDWLGDDGDSARIRSALLIDVNWHADGDVVCLSDIENVGIIHSEALTHHNGDRNAALRLATLKVAAEIGRAIKGSPREKMVNF